MLIDNKQDTLQGNAARQDFSIEMNAVVMDMLYAKVYTDPILATMREISTNAIDACVDAGLPIKYEVNLPTLLNSIFSVRDYGTGLTEEQVKGIYSTMGASSKRDSNAYNGVFGIGKLAPLAYTDSFTVNSFISNTKYSYLISTDAGIPQVITLGNEPTTEPNGLEISVVVKGSDQNTFNKKAADLYRFFDHKPILNQPINYPTVKVDIKGNDWYIEDTNYSNRYHEKLIVIMGNVAYVVPREEFSGTEVQYIARTSLRLHVPIGEVSITPGRESLSMDDKTIKYLTARMLKVSDEAASDFHKNIASLPTAWARAVKYNNSIGSLPYNIQQAVKPKLSDHEKQYFKVTSNYNSTICLADIQPLTPDLTFEHWAQHRVTGKAFTGAYRLPIEDKLHIMIADIRTNVRDAIEAYRATLTGRVDIIVIKFAAWDKDNIPAKTKQAIKFITEMGSPAYVKASDYYTRVAIVKGASTVRTATNFNPIVFDLNYNRTTFRARRGPSLSKYTCTKFYYVEMSALTLTGMPEDTLSVYLRFAKLYKEQNPKNPENFEIVGVPKNGMANIANDPRFVPLEGSMQHLVKYVKMEDTSKSSEVLSGLNSSAHILAELLKEDIPKPLAAFLTAIVDFDKKYPCYNTGIDTSDITKTFKCSTVEPDTKHDYAWLAKEYPLFPALMGCRYTMKSPMISRYLRLEEQNKGLPNGI